MRWWSSDCLPLSNIRKQRMNFPPKCSLIFTPCHCGGVSVVIECILYPGTTKVWIVEQSGYWFFSFHRLSSDHHWWAYVITGARFEASSSTVTTLMFIVMLMHAKEHISTDFHTGTTDWHNGVPQIHSWYLQRRTGLNRSLYHICIRKFSDHFSPFSAHWMPWIPISHSCEQIG